MKNQINCVSNFEDLKCYFFGNKDGYLNENFLTKI